MHCGEVYYITRQYMFIGMVRVIECCGDQGPSGVDHMYMYTPINCHMVCGFDHL